MASRFSNPQAGAFDAYAAGLKLAYQLDPKTQVNAGYRINYQALDFLGAETLLTGPSPTALTPDYSLRLKHTFRYQLNTATAGFSHDFGGDNHQFSLDFQHSAYPGKENSLTALVSESPATPNFQDIVNSWQRDGDSIRAVYRRPMPANGRLLLGTDWQHIDLHSTNFGLQGDDPQGAALNPLLTDRYRGLETQQAYYGTYQQPLGRKLVVLAGVRLETDAVHIRSMGIPAGSQNNARLNPSLNATYNLDKDVQLLFGYSRRMNRPTLIQYDPALLYQSQTTYQQGNPKLKPSTTDSFEATVKYRHADATYTATTYARRNTDAITSFNEPLGSGVFVTRYANLAARRDAGAEFTADGTIVKSLKYSFDTNIYHTQFRNAAAVGFDEEGWVESVKANLNWSPTADDLLQVNASAQGRTVLSQGYGSPYGRLNLGYRRKLIPGLFLTVTADDILATDRKYTQVLRSPGLSQRVTSKFDTRAVLERDSFRQNRNRH